MLDLVASERLDVLADRLAGTLGTPLPDPMAPEWVVVVSAGTERWLRLSLSRRLGTTERGSTDGIAANLDMLFPGRFLSRILGSGPIDDTDPWHLDRLPWAVLDVLHANRTDLRLHMLTTLPPGGTWWGRARRLADLFDRYLLHRPEMTRQWARGSDVDGAGGALSEDATWQPHLWRLVRERIARPSPAELLPERIAALRDGACPPEVPERVSLFGLTTIPGGAPFLDLLDALATQRDVHLFLFRPSPGMARQIRAASPPGAPTVMLRSDDHSVESVVHPLLRSWARPSRDAEVQLLSRDVLDADHATDSPVGEADGHHEQTPTLLARVQADLRASTAPTGELTPRAEDRSILIHSCHGSARQVEVLRDQLLHLLAQDPTLSEDDIVVLCPDVEGYAPLIEAVFGSSADAGAMSNSRSIPREGPPALAYRVADRSLRDTYPLFGAMAALVDLLGSRFAAPTLIDFISLTPVRARFGLDDEAISTVTDWVERADVRWGIDPAHRERWGIPVEYGGGSWNAALDRLLTGVAISDDADSALAVGDVLPLGVEGSDVALAGRLADLLARLSALAVDAARPRPAHEWSALLARATTDLFAVDPNTRWQETRLAATIAAIAHNASIDGEPVPVPLTLADVRRLLGQDLRSAGGRPDFFRGGITISSLTPLRGIPHRVVCLLGMDDGAFGFAGLTGDDLTAAAPHLGDRDRRADLRQALLESVLAAGERLVILRTGHSVVTNRPVPASVPVAELRDIISATLTPEARDAALSRLELVHPRQGFDERNFHATAEDRTGFAVDGPWSFDPVSRDGAAARVGERSAAAPFLAAPLPGMPPGVIDLADLRDFLDHPVRFFLRRILGVSLPEPPDRTAGTPVGAGGSGGWDAPSAVDAPDLLLQLGSLQEWAVRDRLLAHRLAGRDTESFAARERARGSLPPGRLADAALRRATDAVDPLVTAVSRLKVPWGEHGHELVDISLPDGCRILGSVPDACGERPGPVRVYPSLSSPKRRLAAWIDLLVLTATRPEVDWWSVVVTTAKLKDPVRIEPLEIPVADPAERRARALESLAVIVDCYRRGRCEPLPIFPKLSPAVHAGQGAASAWQPFKGMGDGTDRWVQLAFGRATVNEVLAITARDDDPVGPEPERVERYANYLWGAFERSVAPPPDPDATDERGVS